MISSRKGSSSGSDSPRNKLLPSGTTITGVSWLRPNSVSKCVYGGQINCGTSASVILLAVIENIVARRMVLASGFRGSSLRLPLSGMVYCEIATRTLKEVWVLLISKRGRREEKSRGWKRQSLVSRPQNHEPSHAVKILRQLLTFVKGIGPLKCPIERSSTLEFP